ncbi:MAG: hypothetical protein ACLVJ6_14495 [Merdibacter sp.]
MAMTLNTVQSAAIDKMPCQFRVRCSTAQAMRHSLILQHVAFLHLIAEECQLPRAFTSVWKISSIRQLPAPLFRCRLPDKIQQINVARFSFDKIKAGASFLRNDIRARHAAQMLYFFLIVRDIEQLIGPQSCSVSFLDILHFSPTLFRALLIFSAVFVSALPFCGKLPLTCFANLIQALDEYGADLFCQLWLCPLIYLCRRSLHLLSDHVDRRFDLSAVRLFLSCVFFV